MKEKKKVKTGQQSKGGGDDNLKLDVPINNETTIGDGNDDVLDENRSNGGGKAICNDSNDVGKSSDGDNGDGDNTDGFVNSISGNDSNDIVHPPDSDDAVGERKKKVKTGQQSKGGGDNRTGKLAPSITSQCLYDDVFTMYLCHFLPNDLYYLMYTIKQIITYSTSPPNRRIMNPVAEDNFEVGSWTTTPKVITADSSLGFEGNFCEDSLSSQSSYKLNSGCPYYEASIAPNPKLLNDFEPSKKQLETVYGGIMEEVNALRLQIARKKTLSAMDHQDKTINTNIAKVEAQNVVFWILDDIELLDWTTTNFSFARLWFCEDIQHSSILKVAIEKAIWNSTNANLSSKLFQYDSNYQKNQFVGFVSSHKTDKLLTSFHIHSLLVFHTDLQKNTIVTCILTERNHILTNMQDWLLQIMQLIQYPHVFPLSSPMNLLEEIFT